MKKDQQDQEKEDLRQELERNFKAFKKNEKHAMLKNEDLAQNLEQLKSQLKEKE